VSSRKRKIKKRPAELAGEVYDSRKNEATRLRNRRKRGIIDLPSGKVIRVKK
jgi:hypothetical protein